MRRMRRMPLYTRINSGFIAKKHYNIKVCKTISLIFTEILLSLFEWQEILDNILDILINAHNMLH